jgi:hypothetical protein
MPKSQQSWVRFQYPLTQRTVESEGAADEAVLNNVRKKEKNHKNLKNSPLLSR